MLHTYRLLATWLDTSEELASINFSLSVTLVARKQIPKSKETRLIAETQMNR
jgi:hypothetical protein